MAKNSCFFGLFSTFCLLKGGSCGLLQSDGFVQDGKIRRIPFEIKVVGDKAPIYGETLEDLGRFNEDPQLPFNAYGTIALARQEFEANSGSSQVFWLLKVTLAANCKLKHITRRR